MKTRFDICLPRILEFEGGLTNDPTDRGGLTNLGITDSEYRRWLLSQKLKEKSVQYITQAEAAQIYRDEYWNPAGCDSLPSGPDFLMFNTAVNMGIGEARTIANRTTAVASPNLKPDAWIDTFINDQKRVYRIIAAQPGQADKLNGWLRRSEESRAQAHQDVQDAIKSSAWKVTVSGDDAGTARILADGHAYVPARDFLLHFYKQATVTAYLGTSTDGKNLMWNKRTLSSIPVQKDAEGDAWAQLVALCAWLGGLTVTVHDNPDGTHLITVERTPKE